MWRDACLLFLWWCCLLSCWYRIICCVCACNYLCANVPRTTYRHGTKSIQAVLVADAEHNIVRVHAYQYAHGGTSTHVCSCVDNFYVVMEAVFCSREISSLFRDKIYLRSAKKALKYSVPKIGTKSRVRLWQLVIYRCMSHHYLIASFKYCVDRCS